MNKLKYVIKSLWFYKSQNLAILLVSIVSTAVLTGALIIGDSVKYSLNEMVNLRLGKTEFAMTTGERYVRADLAKEMGLDLKTNASALVQVNGIVVQPETNRRLNQIKAYGIDSSFWNFSDTLFDKLNDDEAYLSENLANHLKIKEGDSFILRVQKTGLIPANAPFVADDDQSLALRVRVKKIVGNSHLGLFSLKNNQVPPYNVFLSRQFLTHELELDGLANLILVSANAEKSIDEKSLDKSIQKNWKLKDVSLRIREIENDQIEIASDRVFIESVLSDAIDNLHAKKQKLLTYFVNSIGSANSETPYSFVTSIDSDKDINLADDEIIINTWLASDLNLQKGDSVQLKYYTIGALRKLIEKSKTFQVKAIRPLQSSTWDRFMMPDFPGLSDATSCNEWDAGVPINFSKIRKKDESYWSRYKGTPKAMISFKTASLLWRNKYGNCTAIRFSKSDIDSAELRAQLRKVIQPDMLNLKFESVRKEGKRAADNMVDFASLFLSLSFFIIASAVLLIVLIYSLYLDNRGKETGILLGLGFNQKQILGLRIYESLPTILIGSAFGVLGGIAYNTFLLSALNSVWQDVVRTNMIHVFLNPLSLTAGFLSGVLISLFCILVISRRKLKKSVVDLIQENRQETVKRRKRLVSLAIGLLSLLGTVSMVVYAFTNSLEQNAELLLSAGGLFLVTLAAFFNFYLISESETNAEKTPGILHLAIKNAARNSKRSLSIVLLLGLGSFSVLITGANRKTFEDTENKNQSGTGGYEYWLESTLPVLSDLNTPKGQEKAGFDKGELADDIQFVQLKVQEGDDASCLNLNQVNKPRIIGVNPSSFENKKAFSFAKLLPDVDDANPWAALHQNFGDSIVPAYADQTVILWGLKKSVGDTLIYRDEFGKKMRLLLIGGLANSIFQGNILVADTQFQKHFPSVSGSKIILSDCAPSDSLFVEKTESGLEDLGVTIIKTQDRLAAFYSVENTYLSMFMFLGGLGVIIGTIGFGIMLLRNIWERKKELAVLKAIGYTDKNIFSLLFYENMFLLISGLFVGIASSVIGVLPSLFSQAFQMPYQYVFLLIAAIFASGILWILLPLLAFKKRNILSYLKSE